MSEQRAEHFRRQLVRHNDRRRTAAREELVPVHVVLAAGERDDLRRDVRGQLLLAGRALDHHVVVHLVLSEADELQRDDIGALVEQLIEGMLAVRAGLAEDDRTGHVIDRLAETVHRLAVRLHVELLQMSREAGQRLRVRKHRRHAVAEEVALIDADQGVEEGCIFPDIRVLRESVLFRRSGKDAGEDVRSERQRQDRAADHGRRGVTAADVVVHVEGIEVIRVVGERGSVRGDRDHVPGRVEAGFTDGIFDEGLVGQGLERRAGLGDQDEERMRDVDLRKDRRGVVRVDVADELRIHEQGLVGLCPALEREIEGTRAEVAAADTDLDDGRELLACLIDDLAGMHLLREFRRTLLLRDIELALVHAVDDHVIAELAAAELMQDAAVLAGVDALAAVEGCVLLCQFRLVRERLQRFQGLIVDRLGREAVDHPRTHRDLVILNALRAALAAHHGLDVDRGQRSEFLKCIQFRKIFPFHTGITPFKLENKKLCHYYTIAAPHFQSLAALFTKESRDEAPPRASWRRSGALPP